MRARSRLALPAAILAGLIPVLVACGGAEPVDAAAGSRAVSFRAADGVGLSGRVFGPEDARTGVILAHMLPADQSSWFEFAGRLAGEGYRAMTFDFRGYCPGGDAGCSEGRKDVSADTVDLQAALDYLRSQGVETVAIVGASMGGTAALLVAADEGDRVAAVITLSAPQQIEGLVAGPDVVGRVTAAKLFVAGSGDGAAAQAAEAFDGQSPAPKRLEIVPSDDHGTDLLTGNQAEIVRTLLLSYLGQYAPA